MDGGLPDEAVGGAGAMDGGAAVTDAGGEAVCPEAPVPAAAALEGLGWELELAAGAPSVSEPPHAVTMARANATAMRAGVCARGLIWTPLMNESRELPFS
jgi:hypothetical protein